MQQAINRNVDPFNRDAESHGGYLYTATDSLSSVLATSRSTETILDVGRFAGRSVLDIGCGDGYYTLRFWDYGKPRSMIGLDAASSAIEVANRNKGTRLIEFQVGDAHHLPYPDDSFDLVLIQSILHHDDNPLDVIREAFRVAPEILVHEPNGNNLGLKLIEKISHYHREHGEKSYSSWLMRRWVEQAGGRITRRRFVGFVPMFCPDWLARTMKSIEPAIERAPVVSKMLCSVYVLTARRTRNANNSPGQDPAC